MLRRPFTLACPWILAAVLGGCASAPAPAPAAADPIWFVFLESGRKTPADREAVAAMQRGHIDNFKRLFAAGQLFAAGPLRDPSGLKRGIVTVRAADMGELRQLFQPDEYVREGYLTLNAVPATVQRALNTEGVDASRVEEVRIVLIGRPATPATAATAATAATEAARAALLRGLLARGTFGAWYSLRSGPVAEVLFARSTDTAALQAALADYPGLGQDGATLAVWGQWLSPGVVR